MRNSLLQRIESKEAVVCRNLKYSQSLVEKCQELHGAYVKQGMLEGAFQDEKWMGYSGVEKFGIDFTLNPRLYASHIGKAFGISEETMKDMLRCYAVSCFGTYILQTVSRDKIKVIRRFLQAYGDKELRMCAEDKATVEDFLLFIDTPAFQIRKILSSIRLAGGRMPSSRQLSPVINYLAIENEVNRIYGNYPDDETFRRWFPVYFWVNITFVLPLRPTEMLLTPKECIIRKDGAVLLKIRRTNLKKGHKTVYYDVDRDYTLYSYEVPDTETVRNIERYQEMTRFQDRRFLFEYEDQMSNAMLSLESFNRLLAAFMEKYIMENSRYDFAKSAFGIPEFSPVTAGDSRPIAMANLYFQRFGADICRQLADHENINTSSGYYCNISETIWASSLIRIQEYYEHQDRREKEQFERGQTMLTNIGHSMCLSEKRLADEEDLRDCIEQGHLADCMGCRYYRPTREDLHSFMRRQKARADEAVKRMLELMDRTLRAKGREETVEEVFLSVQTEAVRCRMGCQMEAEEEYREWQGHRNI